MKPKRLKRRNSESQHSNNNGVSVETESENNVRLQLDQNSENDMSKLIQSRSLASIPVTHNSQNARLISKRNARKSSQRRNRSQKRIHVFGNLHRQYSSRSLFKDDKSCSNVDEMSDDLSKLLHEEEAENDLIIRQKEKQVRKSLFYK